MPMPTVVLNLREMVPVIRQAIADKSLQIYTSGTDNGCYYNGPCAIGVCIQEGDRAVFDIESPVQTDTSVAAWLNQGNFVAAFRTDPTDLVLLQHAHDSLGVVEFEAAFERIAANYS